MSGTSSAAHRCERIPQNEEYLHGEDLHKERRGSPQHEEDLHEEDLHEERRGSRVKYFVCGAIPIFNIIVIISIYKQALVTTQPVLEDKKYSLFERFSRKLHGLCEDQNMSNLLSDDAEFNCFYIELGGGAGNSILQHGHYMMTHGGKYWVNQGLSSTVNYVDDVQFFWNLHQNGRIESSWGMTFIWNESCSHKDPSPDWGKIVHYFTENLPQAQCYFANVFGIPSNAVKKTMNELYITDLGNKWLTSVHIRYGDKHMKFYDPKINAQYRISDSRSVDEEKIMKKIEESTSKSDSVVFVTSDVPNKTKHLQDWLKRKGYSVIKQNLIDSTPLHIKDAMLMTDKGKGDEARRQTLVDWFMLVMSDHLIAGSKSTFNIAAKLAGLHYEKGSIVKL